MEKAAQPSPAEMLDEALEHVTKALDLLDKAGPAGEYLSFVSVVVKGNRFHDALAELKREAEAREAPNGR